MPSAPSSYQDSLELMLGRIVEGKLPETPYELLHHPETVGIVVEATRETLSKTDMGLALLGGAPMNPLKVHQILTSGRQFQDREPEAAQGINWQAFTTVVERKIAECLKQSGDTGLDRLKLTPSIYDLTKLIPSIVVSLMEGWHPMTLKDMKIFEECTRGKEKYVKYREAVLSEGKKPRFDALIGESNVVPWMNDKIGNTSVINLLLAAIEQNDHEDVAMMMKDILKGGSDLGVILKYIIHEPILHVSVEMLNALAELYAESGRYYDSHSNLIEKIMKEPTLQRYKPCISTLSQRALRKFDPNSAQSSPIVSIGTYGTDQELEQVVEEAIKLATEVKEQVVEEDIKANINIAQIARQLYLITILQRQNDEIAARAKAIIDKKRWEELVKFVR